MSTVTTETRTLRKVGRSVLLTIPKVICDSLNLSEGKDVEIKAANGQMVIRPVREKMSVKDRIAQYQAKGITEVAPLFHDPVIEAD